MIVNQFIQWLISILGGSHFDVNFDGSVPALLQSALSIIAYVLPLDTLLQIFGISVIIYTVRLTVSLIKAIWELIPLL